MKRSAEKQVAWAPNDLAKRLREQAVFLRRPIFVPGPISPVEIAGKYDEAASRIELLEELLAEALTQYEYRRGCEEKPFRKVEPHAKGRAVAEVIHLALREERSKVSGTRRQP